MQVSSSNKPSKLNQDHIQYWAVYAVSFLSWSRSRQEGQNLPACFGVKRVGSIQRENLTWLHYDLLKIPEAGYLGTCLWCVFWQGTAAQPRPNPTLKISWWIMESPEVVEAKGTRNPLELLVDELELLVKIQGNSQPKLPGSLRILISLRKLCLKDNHDWFMCSMVMSNVYNSWVLKKGYVIHPDLQLVPFLLQCGLASMMAVACRSSMVRAKATLFLQDNIRLGGFRYWGWWTKSPPLGMMKPCTYTVIRIFLEETGAQF